MSVLILADHHDGQLAGTTAHVVAAAQQIVKDSGLLAQVIISWYGDRTWCGIVTSAVLPVFTVRMV